MSASKISFMVGLVVLLAACTPETQKKARKAYGVVTFVKGKVTINDVKARIGSKVTQNDTIVSGANSTAVVQFQKNALMVIKAKTTVNLQAIAKKNNKTALNVIQQKGSTFHKIIKSQRQKNTSNVNMLKVNGKEITEHEEQLEVMRNHFETLATPSEIQRDPFHLVSLAAEQNALIEKYELEFGEPIPIITEDVTKKAILSLNSRPVPKFKPKRLRVLEFLIYSLSSIVVKLNPVIR